MTQADFEAKMKEMKAPLPFKIFKGVKGKFGAMRLNFKKPYTNEPGKKQEGVLFLEMAPPKTNNIYDWDNKIILALNITDISKLLYFFKAPQKHVDKNNSDNLKVTIYHDKDAGTANEGKNVKILDISKSKDRTNFFMSLKDKGNNSQANVTVSPDEAIAIMTLLEYSIPSILSWNSTK